MEQKPGANKERTIMEIFELLGSRSSNPNVLIYLDEHLKKGGDSLMCFYNQLQYLSLSFISAKTLKYILFLHGNCLLKIIHECKDFYNFLNTYLTSFLWIIDLPKKMLNGNSLSDMDIFNSLQNLIKEETICYVIGCSRVFKNFSEKLALSLSYISNISAQNLLTKDAKAQLIILTNSDRFKALQCQEFKQNLPLYPYNGDYRALKILLTIYVILKPKGDVDTLCQLVEHYIAYEEISLPYFYFNIVKICIKNIVKHMDKESNQRWVAFTYLQLPKIIKHVKNVCALEPNSQQTNNNNDSLIQSLSLQRNIFNSLENNKQLRYGYEVYRILIQEFVNQNVLQVEEANQLQLDKKIVETQDLKLSASPQLILKVNSTLDNLINTFDLDITKNVDSLTQVLCHIIINKNLEAILLVAANTGKLGLIYDKLISFIENRKEASAEGSKSSNSRALLFDISFLALTYLVQNYDHQHAESEISQGETPKYFYLTWARSYLPLPKCYGNNYSLTYYQDPFSNRDKNKVEAYLSMFLSPNFEFKTTLVKWNDITSQIPYVFYELFLALHEDVISKDVLYSIMDKIRFKVCSLLITVFVWTNFYLKVIDYELFQFVKRHLDNYFESSITDNGNSSSVDSVSTNVNPALVDINLKSSLQDRWSLFRCIITSIKNNFRNEPDLTELIPGNKGLSTTPSSNHGPITMTDLTQHLIHVNKVFKWELTLEKLKPYEADQFLIYTLAQLFDCVQTQANLLAKIPAKTPELPLHTAQFTQFLLNRKESIIGLCYVNLPLAMVCYADSYLSLLSQKHLFEMMNEPMIQMFNQILLYLISSIATVYKTMDIQSTDILHNVIKNDLNRIVMKDDCSIEEMINNIIATIFDTLLQLSTSSETQNSQNDLNILHLVFNVLTNIANMKGTFKVQFVNQLPIDLVFNVIRAYPTIIIPLDTLLLLYKDDDITNSNSPSDASIKLLPILHTYHKTRN